MDAQGGVWRGIRQVKTCTECKQSKLRCDSRAKFPGSCSRCEERKLACTVDQSFRRTPARKRLEAMSKELEELRQRKQNSTEGGQSLTPSVSDTPQIDRDGAASSAKRNPGDHDLDFDPTVTTIHIGNEVFGRQLAIDAFRLFVTFFHPQFPLAGPISINETYRSSPVLFWTIISIVADRVPDLIQDPLCSRLEGPVRGLMGRELLAAPLPLHKIHALLYLCIWPLRTKHQPEDPSWLYAGVAMNAARYMGLHRTAAPPSLKLIGVPTGNLPVRAHTWIACFCVGNNLAMHLGLPPLISSPPDLATVRQLMSEHPVPRQIEIHAKLHMTLATLTNTLFHSDSDLVDSSLVQLLDTELNSLISTTASEDWATSLDELYILTAKLYTHVMVIVKRQTSTQSRDILLKLAFATSVRIVHLAARLPHQMLSQAIVSGAETSEPTPGQKARTLTKHFFRGTAFAVIFLLRFFILSPNNVAPEERQLASKHVTLGQNIFKSSSLVPGDDSGRAAAVFKALSGAPPFTSDNPANLSRWLSDRMGASIMLDTLRIASEVRGKPLGIVENASASEGGPPVDQQATQAYLTQDLGTEAWLQGTVAIDLYGNELWGDPTWSLLNYDMGPPYGEVYM